MSLSAKNTSNSDTRHKNTTPTSESFEPPTGDYRLASRFRALFLAAIPERYLPSRAQRQFRVERRKDNSEQNEQSFEEGTEDFANRTWGSRSQSCTQENSIRLSQITDTSPLAS